MSGDWSSDVCSSDLFPSHDSTIQKPIELYEWILLNYGADANLILDTHVGSGSSRIACHKMNKEFVGFEIDPDYYEAQEARFKKFVQQLRLW